VIDDKEKHPNIYELSRISHQISLPFCKII
jgi:hypothetical protein